MVRASVFGDCKCQADPCYLFAEINMHQFQRICTLSRQINVHQLGVSISNVNRLILSPHIHPINKPDRQYSTAPNASCKIPASQLETKTHPLGWERIQAQVEPYFGNNWGFASEEKKKGFLALGLSRAFSNSFPLTLDDRIGATCKMFYLSLLIDGKFLH